MLKIAIADDKPINRNILTDNLRRSGKVEVLFAAKNGLDFLEKLKLQDAKNQLPQVVLMDIEMPELDGIEAVFRAKKAFPTVNFLMLTVFEDDAKIFEAIRSGAVGYLLKGESPDVLVRAIEEVVTVGGAPMSPVIARKALRLLSNASNLQQNEAEKPVISEREMDILRLVVEGLDYKEIGLRLFISPHTARTHIGAIYKKLHVHSKGEAITLAHRKGWV